MLYEVITCASPHVVVPVFVTVEKHPPGTVFVFKESSMPFAPPFFRLAFRSDDRVIGRIFPWPQRRFGTCRYHHVAGRRPGGSALCIGEVIIFAALCQFGAFEAGAFNHPFFGELPAIVNFSGLLVIDSPSSESDT